MKKYKLLVSVLIIFILSMVVSMNAFAATMTVTDSAGTALVNGSSVHYTGDSTTVTVSLSKASFNLYVNDVFYSYTTESSMNVILTNPGPNTKIKADNQDGSQPAEIVINFYHDTVYTGGSLSYQSIKMKVTFVDSQPPVSKDPVNNPDCIVSYDGANNTGVNPLELKDAIVIQPGIHNIKGQLMVRVFVNGVPDGDYWTLDDQATLFSYPWGSIADELIQRQKWNTVVPIPWTGSINAAVSATPNPANIMQGTTATVNVSIDSSASQSTLESSASTITSRRYWASTNESDLLNDALGEVLTTPTATKQVPNVSPNSTIYVKVRVFDQSLADKGLPATSEATTTVYVGAILLPNAPPALGIDANPKSVKTGAAYTVIDKTSFSSPATKIVEWEVKEEFMPKGSSTWQTIFSKTKITNPATFYKSYTKTQEGTYRYTITYAKDDKGQSTTGNAYVDVVVSADPVVPDNNKPPVAIITSADTVEAGETLTMSGSRSYDPDPGDYVNEYYWITSVGRPNPFDKSNTSMVFGSTGDVNLSLGVIDTHGAEGNTQKKVTVVPPVPHAVIDVTGTLKENRKVTLSASRSYGNSLYTVNKAASVWTITPVTAGLTAADIKYLGTLTGEVKDVLFKKAGQYKVSLTVYNTFSPAQPGTTEQIITIGPDLAPIANFSIPNTTYRNPANGNKATINITDLSYSNDGDSLQQRIWQYAYDSDNDGMFSDETWITFDSANKTSLGIDFTQVGKYMIRLTVKENLDPATIPDFIVDSDYKRGNTDYKSYSMAIVEVLNIAPVADLSGNKMTNIDLIVATDYTGVNFTNLQAKLNAYIAKSYGDYLDIRVNYVTDTKYLGRYLPEGLSGFGTVQNTNTAVYQRANWNGLIEYSDHTYTATYRTSRLYPSDITVTTNGVFPAYVKKSARYNYDPNSGNYYAGAWLWLLENGDLYFMGTNSTNNAGVYSSIGIFTLQPTKIMSNVKQIEGGDTLYFILTNDGNVYAIGNDLYGKRTVPYFTAYENELDLTPAIPYTQDSFGTNQISYWAHNTMTGYGSATQVRGLSGIDYIWSSGSALVARSTSGKWYGLGSGLNAFGLHTGFQNTPPAHVWEAGSIHTQSYMLDTYYFDNVHYVTEIPYLSSLDSTLGGIEKVAPNTVYARNGDVYNIKQTAELYYGSRTYPSLASIPAGLSYTLQYSYPTVPSYTVYFPRQFYDWGFTYNKTGAWTAGSTIYTYTYDYSSYSITPDYVQANGVPITPYLEVLDKPLTWQEEVTNYFGSIKPPIMPSKIFTNKNPLPIRSGVTDYKSFVYVVDYTYLYKVYDASTIIRTGTKADGYSYSDGYRYYYTATIRPYVYPFEYQYQAGIKTYGMDFKNLPGVSLRSNAKKYFLYLDENDSFKKISSDINTYVINNNLDVKVSVNNAYLDEIYDAAKEVSLRQFAGVTPKGAIYGQYAIDQMLLDITNENAVVKTGNKIYVLINEDNVTYNKSYADYESDLQNAERFKYDHDAYYFENSQGLASYSGQWLGTTKNTFDKVGKYVVTYQAQDNPKNNLLFQNYWLWSNGTNQLEIYAHRRPIADFLAFGTVVNPTTKTLKIKSKAYDLDHISQANKGIVSTEWKWKFANNDTTWKDGYPATVTKGNPIYVWQRVLDLEGAWSYPKIMFIDADTLPINNPPTVDANPQSVSWTNQDVYVTVTAYDADNNFDHTFYLWTTSTAKPTGGWLSSANISFVTAQNATGTWYLHMEAFDFYDESFYRYRGPYQIDKLAPTISADVSSGNYSNTFQVTLSTTDTGGSGLKRFDYIWSSSSTNPGGIPTSIGISNVPGINNYSVPLTQPNEGTWYLHAWSYDIAGNSTYVVYGPFVLQRLKLENLRITSITDPRWKDYFVGYDRQPTSLKTNGIKVKDMPVYNNKEHNGIKLGYMTSFKIDSVGLDGANDKVNINVNYFVLDSSNTLYEADIYVESSDGNYQIIDKSEYRDKAKNILLTATNRLPYELNPNDAKSNTWYFEYFLPPTAKAVKKGEGLDLISPNYYNYKLLVTFDIKAQKSTGETYDYTAKEKAWSTGDGNTYGENRPTQLDLLGKGINHGEVLWYNLYENALEDLDINRKW